jgi:hypothetical protein
MWEEDNEDTTGIVNKLRIGCLRPDICSKHLITSSSYGLRYCWPRALSCIEGRPRARWWSVEWGTLPWSARARYDLCTPRGTPYARTWLALSILSRRRDGDVEGDEWRALQCPGTNVLPPADRMFEKPALTPWTWLGLRIVVKYNIASPGVNIVNFVEGQCTLLSTETCWPSHRTSVTPGLHSFLLWVSLKFGAILFRERTFP